MTAYTDFICNNKDKVIIKIVHSIDDETLYSYFFRQTNIHCDGHNYYVQGEITSVPIKNKKELRKFLSQIKGRMKLCSTDNSLGHTRLIYTVRLK